MRWRWSKCDIHGTQDRAICSSQTHNDHDAKTSRAQSMAREENNYPRLHRGKNHKVLIEPGKLASKIYLSGFAHSLALHIIAISPTLPQRSYTLPKAPAQPSFKAKAKRVPYGTRPHKARNRSMINHSKVSKPHT
jgi:hypothetical protein